MVKNNVHVIDEVKGLYKIIPLNPMRRTPNVAFDTIPVNAIPRVDSIHRVIHGSGAVSPAPMPDVDRPWYMHPFQDDNLLVVHGIRYIEIYTSKNGAVESFTVTPHLIKKNGKLIFEGPAILSWPCNVFHRVQSCDKTGSVSLNFATHYDGFDSLSNFNIYDLNTDTGKYKVVREGKLDQPE